MPFSLIEYNKKHWKWFSTSARKRSFEIMFTKPKWTCGDAMETTRHSVFDNENFWTWACDQLKPIPGEQITLKNMWPQWVLHLSPQYSNVTLVSGYPFWQLFIDHNMDGPLAIKLKTVSVKILGTLYCLLAHPMLMHKIWWLAAINNTGRMSRQAKSKKKKQHWVEESHLFLSKTGVMTGHFKKILPAQQAIRARTLL